MDQVDSALAVSFGPQGAERKSFRIAKHLSCYGTQEVLFMHEYPIEGVRTGPLRAEKDGLYWKIDASRTRDWDHPDPPARRDGRRPREPLGVPQPEGEKLAAAVPALRPQLPPVRRHPRPHRSAAGADAAAL